MKYTLWVKRGETLGLGMIDDSDLPIISNAVKGQIAQIFATGELVKKGYVAKHSLAYNMASGFREIEVKDDYSVAFRSD